MVAAAAVVLAVAVVRARRRAPGAPGTGGSGPADPFATGDVDALRGDPRTLKPGDIVEIRGRSYAVRGTLRFTEGDWGWAEHLLDDAAGNRTWLSVEEDPDLELVLWNEVPTATIRPGEPTVDFDGRRYVRDEGGHARYTATGTTGLDPTGTVEYHDYAAPDGALLSFEALRRQRPVGGGPWRAAAPQRAAHVLPGRVTGLLVSLDTPYADTTAADLSFALGLPAQPALHVLDLTWRGLELRLLGASHQVVLADSCVETVACLPGRPPHLPATVDDPAAGYRFTAAVRRLAPAGLAREVAALRDRLARDPYALVGVFPGQPGRGHRDAARGATRRGRHRLAHLARVPADRGTGRSTRTEVLAMTYRKWFLVGGRSRWSACSWRAWACVRQLLPAWLRGGPLQPVAGDDIGDDVVAYTSSGTPSEVAERISGAWEPADRYVDGSGVYLRYDEDAVVVLPAAIGSLILVERLTTAYPRYHALSAATGAGAAASASAAAAPAPESSPPTEEAPCCRTWSPICWSRSRTARSAWC